MIAGRTLLLLLVVGRSTCQGQIDKQSKKTSKIIHYKNENNGVDGYDFCFETEDGTIRHEKGSFVGGIWTVIGTSVWRDFDGTAYIDEYKADDKGSNVKMRRMMGNFSAATVCSELPHTQHPSLPPYPTPSLPGYPAQPPPRHPAPPPPRYPAPPPPRYPAPPPPRYPAPPPPRYPAPPPPRYPAPPPPRYPAPPPPRYPTPPPPRHPTPPRPGYPPPTPPFYTAVSPSIALPGMIGGRKPISEGAQKSLVGATINAINKMMERYPDE
ncbi:hypothetical protein GE061_016436 [Apolygus lucorum]|uniref:Uncharacterized protein n=1 Tax=Apolygus lucorum TaxID=248454 RepID=A0A6A4JFW0_APOLU|nr:hypothetical protein GE061_016436 [Apolygus lucorum]